MTAPDDDGLLSVVPRWVSLSGEYTDGDRVLRALTLLDEAVALGAPFLGFGLQVGIGVTLLEPDAGGLPTPEEKARLKAFEAGLVQALGVEGRLVAHLTTDGVREYVAYLRSTDVLVPWQHEPPAGMADHDWQVQVLEDPSWLGLREIAGLLQPGEEQLDPLQGPA